MYLTKPDNTSSTTFKINIPWDKNTAKGFTVALALTGITILILSYVSLGPPKKYDLSSKLVTIELMNLGKGDGTGRSKGNLTKEGKKARGNKRQINLEDTKFAKKAIKKTNKPSSATLDESNNIVVVRNNKSKKIDKNAKTGDDLESVGINNQPVDELALGLGNSGVGRGEGDGFGKISWGGGGGRTVTNKVMPKVRKKLNTSLALTFEITVMPDGTVSRVICTERAADPSLMRSVQNALRKWKFSPRDDDKIMKGRIPFKFIVS